MTTMLVASVAMVAVLARNWLMVPSTQSPQPAARELAKPSSPVAIDPDAVRGNKNARVAIVEFSDFRCPYCARFTRDTLPRLETKYIDSGKVLFAFRQLPNDKHPFSRDAATVAVCAGAQGRFWDAHDRFFKNADEFDGVLLGRSGADLGLNQSSLSDCLKSAGPQSVAADAATARELRIASTPAFFIGLVRPDGQVDVLRTVSGAQQFEVFDEALKNVIGASTGSDAPQSK